jgi:cyclophilin family peptidyl-prolyl cis-trans isomerase
MIFLYGMMACSLPLTTHEGYIDVCVDRVRSGRIDIGFFGTAAPHTLRTLERGLKCHYGDYCYRGTYFSDYIPGNSIAIGAEFENKGENYSMDYPATPCNLAYLVCSVPNDGHPSGKMIFTLRAEADVPPGAFAIGRVSSGKNTFQKIVEFAETGGSVNNGARISSCGLRDFKDPDIDL